ncbi:exodeoxyribonuclease VII small subunit [Anaeroselena agilis]|uniref:Exodeoxyribonuclease 7 small subunit n=1 Tax=Anaeroselena agilis TaxID=3063788 RepID=A0ABU3NW89_9FIRM|nr:exodeoxyribonuclease VII small subunit [Selenomonadales bacterium 4137-cl]
MRKKAREQDVCFEDALGKLESIVKELEKGELPLEDALGMFAEGVGLSQICLTKLNAAEQAVDKIVREEKGQLNEYPLKVEEGEKC